MDRLRSWWHSPAEGAASDSGSVPGSAIPQPAHSVGSEDDGGDQVRTAVFRAVTAHRMRRRSLTFSPPEARLYFTNLERTEEETSFGLALNEHMRIIALEEGCPSARAGLCVLDRIVEVDDEVSVMSTIPSQVADKRSVKVTIERPVPSLLMRVADEENVVEWSAWIRAVIAVSGGNTAEVVEQTGCMYDHKLNPWSRQLSRQEANYLRSVHLVEVEEGESLIEIAKGTLSGTTLPQIAAASDPDAIARISHACLAENCAPTAGFGYHIKFTTPDGAEVDPPPGAPPPIGIRCDCSSAAAPAPLTTMAAARCVFRRLLFLHQAWRGLTRAGQAARGASAVLLSPHAWRRETQPSCVDPHPPGCHPQGCPHG
jgi:hypothetical protein